MTSPSRHVFISYSRKEHDLAKTIATELESAGHSVFIDYTIPIGSDWPTHIEEEILKADFVVLLLSRNAAESNYVGTEVQIASDSLSKHNKPVIFPIRVQFPSSEKLPFHLQAILSRIQHMEWNSEKDTDPLCEHLVSRINNSDNVTTYTASKPSSLSSRMSKGPVLASVVVALALVVLFVSQSDAVSFLFNQEMIGRIIPLDLEGQPNTSPSELATIMKDIQLVEYNTKTRETPDEIGFFELPLPQDLVSAGALDLKLISEGYILLDPAENEQLLIPGNLKTDVVEITVARKGSKALLYDERLFDFIAQALRKNIDLSRPGELGEPSEQLLTLAKKWGFTANQLEEKIAVLSDSTDACSQGYRAYARFNYNEAITHFKSCADIKQDVLDDLRRSAATQSERSNAERKYTKLLRTLGDVYFNSGDFEGALDAYKSARISANSDLMTDLWLDTLIDIGKALAMMGAQQSGEAMHQHFQKSIETFKEAIAEGNPSTFFRQRGRAYNNLGVVYNEYGLRSKGELGRDYLDEASDAFDKAEEVYTREHAPADWLQVQNNIAIVKQDIGNRGNHTTGFQDLRESLALFQNLLADIDRDSYLEDWGRLQHNLGTVILDIAVHPGTPQDSIPLLLQESIEAFETALTIRTDSTSPTAWALTQNNLGNARLYLSQLIQDPSSKYAMLQQATQQYRNALREYSLEETPQAWAGTLNNLCAAQTDMSVLIHRLNPRASLSFLKDAVQQCNTALQQVRTLEDLPLLWAETQFNLANALLTRGMLEPSPQSLSDALVLYTDSLPKVWHKDYFPQEWTKTQNQKGKALAVQSMFLIEMSDAEEAAITAQQSLDIMNVIAPVAGASSAADRQFTFLLSNTLYQLASFWKENNQRMGDAYAFAKEAQRLMPENEAYSHLLSELQSTIQ